MELTAPLATRYQVCEAVLILSPCLTMAVMVPLAGQAEIVRSTTLVESAYGRMLPNSCDGDKTIRSKSFTSCLSDAVEPGGSVHAKTNVTGIACEGVHAIVKAEAPDVAENVSEA